MILKRKINTLSRSELLKLNRGLKESCGLLFGDSGIEVRTYNRTQNLNVAYYDPSIKRITINRGMISDINSYVKTFIHEWIHSRQKKLQKNYLKYEKKYGYWHNPYEVEARQAEKEYKSVIWKMTKMTF